VPPRSFGKYEVLARLATGGAASIFLARQPGAAGFTKLVALKTLLAERSQDEDFVAMFLDEARLAARLNHPNCVQIYDLGRVRGVYYISMEYIFGETLWNLLTTVTKLKTPLPPAHVAAIIASVCDGLHHAHELKDAQGRPYHLVHRDVSPQNVMITFEGQTKVVDFGIAKAETGRAPTIAGIVKGKFSYMSPEQITGSAVDRRSDIFSLGIVMFECLASRRLYRGDTPEEIAKLILEHRAPRLRDVVPDIPLPLDEICATALSRHPSKRFQSAQQMADALRVYLDEVRHNQGASHLARLMVERFGGMIEERRQVYEASLMPNYDEAALIKVLDARPVRELDLFPEERPVAPDFHEETIDDQKKRKKEEALHPFRGAPNSAVTGPVEGPSSGEHHGAGFRVELTGAGGAVSQISVLPEDTPADDQSHPQVAVVAEDGAESKTQFDPAPPVVGDTAPRPAARAETGFADTQIRQASDPSANELTETNEYESYRDPTPFNGINGVVPARPVSEADSSETPPGPEAPKEEAVTLPPPYAGVLEPLSPSANTAPPSPRPQIEVSPQLTPRPVLVTPAPAAPSVLVRVAEDSGRRYTTAALLAALGFGISIGLVLGVILARLVLGA
jgi:serine/threonine protein kinase